MKGNFVYKRLGNQLVYLRKNAGMSQEELAHYSGVDRSYLARIECGNANPSISILYKLAKCLRCRISQIIKLVCFLYLLISPVLEYFNILGLYSGIDV